MSGRFPWLDITFDLSDIENACARAQFQIDHAPERMVRSAATEGLEEARRTRRYKDQTGALTKSAIARLESSGSRFAEGVIEWRVPYASFVDAGTSPHEIVARKAPELSFYWTKMGRWFRGPKVNHPGTRPYGFAGVAVQKAERVLEREFEAAFRRVEAILQ